MEKKTVHLKLRTVSPIHVGAAQEKHLTRGVDYLVKDDRIYFLDEKKIVKDFDLHRYVTALSNRDLDKLLRPKGIEKYAHTVASVSGEVGADIKKHIIDPLSSQLYTPGTSLKGALRSVLYNRSKAPYHRNETDTFGRIDEDPFRYLQVGDSRFSESKFYNSKTFNLIKDGSSFYGGWKNSLSRRNGPPSSSTQFKSSGFTFPYECISVGAMADVRIVMNASGYRTAINKILRIKGKEQAAVKSVPVVKESLDDLSTFLKYIQDCSAQYITSEIKFFEKYSNAETDSIIKVYKELEILNQQAPLLRLGQGSGFHSITGNYIHPTDHSIDGLDKSRGQKNRKDSAKSRKFVFEKVDGEYMFYPMGYVQLLDPESHRDILEKLKADNDERIAAIKLAKETEQARIQAEAQKDRLRIEEAKKPKMTSPTLFKKNKPLLVDAKVIRSKRPQIFLNIYVEGYEGQEFTVRYPAGMEENTIVQIKAQMQKGKLILQGAPTIKKVK